MQSRKIDSECEMWQRSYYPSGITLLDVKNVNFCSLNELMRFVKVQIIRREKCDKKLKTVSIPLWTDTFAIFGVHANNIK